MIKPFLKNNVVLANTTEEFFVSDRFKDEDGNVIPFVLRMLKPSEIVAIQNSGLVKKAKGYEVDSAIIQKNLVVASVEEPDLINAELLASYGVNTPHELLDEMLTGAEYLSLSAKCMSLQGLDKTLDEKVNEVKN